MTSSAEQELNTRILAHLRQYQLPRDGQEVSADQSVAALTVKDKHIRLVLEVDAKAGPVLEDQRRLIEKSLQDIFSHYQILVILTAHQPAPALKTPPHAARQSAPLSEGKRPPRKPLQKQDITPAGVAAIIAVASGKGGVGKSTTTINLALTLQQQGLRCGIIDADIYGPSLPMMFDLYEKPDSPDGKSLTPLEKYNLKLMSIGLLVDAEAPMIWRGPMVQSAVIQMIRDVNWGKLDVLLIDMPPGTGDAQLTLAQQLRMTGAIIVSTPQDLALLDARKAYHMFAKTHVPVIGMIENMSILHCPHCAQEIDIFGRGGTKAAAEKLGCPYLGDVPLDIALRQSADQGVPLLYNYAQDSEHPVAKAYQKIGQHIGQFLAQNQRF